MMPCDAGSPATDDLALFRGIFEHATIGIFQTTPGGRYIRVNRALAHMYGYASAEQLMATLTDIAGQLYVDPRSRDAFRRALAEGEAVRDFESRIRRADGRVIWISENARVVNGADGAPLYYEGFVTDITRRRQLELRLSALAEELETRVARRTQQLETEIERRALGEATLAEALQEAQESTRAAERFFASVSHELRTPLNSILGFSDMIRSLPPATLSVEESRQYIDMIHQSGRQLLDMVNDILDISKINAGKLDLSQRRIGLHDNLESCMDMMAPQARELGVKLRCRFYKTDPVLRGDGRRLKQVFLNLLANAIKFTPRDGTVTLTTDISAGGRVEITVADTGPGIDPADIAKVLSTYGQAGQVAGQIHQGTGLGLPISKKLIELHGGTFSLESAPGQGTLVRIILPESPPPAGPRIRRA